MQPKQLLCGNLLGLPLSMALEKLKSMGEPEPQVVWTKAPARREPSPEDALRTPEGEAAGLSSARVIAVSGRNEQQGGGDGLILVVSRFLTGMPKKRPE